MKKRAINFTTISDDDLITYLETTDRIPESKYSIINKKINAIQGSLYNRAIELFNQRAKNGSSTDDSFVGRSYSNQIR